MSNKTFKLSPLFVYESDGIKKVVKIFGIKIQHTNKYKKLCALVSETSNQLKQNQKDLNNSYKEQLNQLKSELQQFYKEQLNQLKSELQQFYKKEINQTAQNLQQDYKDRLNKHSDELNKTINEMKLFYKEELNKIQREIQPRLSRIADTQTNLTRGMITIQERLLSITDFKKALEIWYRSKTGHLLNLDNPQTYNEKIQWLKLYDSTPDKTRLADKYLVRDWVAEKIGAEYLVPLLGVYDKFEDIDFDKLPNQFVIKCNHGSGYNIIVKDKSQMNIDDIKNKVNQWMCENFAYRYGYELHYRDIEPKIIIEKYIENQGTNDLYDYKFWCFDGKVYYIQFLSERNLDGLKMAFYDKKWNKQNFVYNYPLDTKNIEKPDNLDEMIKLAEKLSKGFSHVRVDFYRMNDGKLYFGEMTFSSASGVSNWNDETINQKFGDLIKLPSKIYDLDTKQFKQSK